MAFPGDDPISYHRKLEVRIQFRVVDQRLSKAYSMVRPGPSMHSQESRSCSGCRLLSQQLQAQIGLLWPGAMVQLIPASKNHLDFSVMVHRSNSFTYGPAINSDCSSYFDSWDLDIIDKNPVAPDA